MSWMTQLHATYERCAGNEPEGAVSLMPICHTTQQVQVEIVIDEYGAFKRALVLDKGAGTTMIPCTESSGGRAGAKPVNHPLADKLQYVARDFVAYGGEVTSGFSANPHEPYESFLTDLKAWANSMYSHPKLSAVLRYVERGNLIADLVNASVLPVDANGKLMKEWTGEKENAPAIFKAIQNTQTPADAFVRWRVEAIGNPVSATWEDPDLIQSWIDYYKSTQTKRGVCMASGVDTPLAIQHPAKLRHGGDKAKLISSNDTSGFTFRGRFLDTDEALSIGFDVTQKAHNALRWLIARQGYRNGEQVIVSWAVAGKPVPDPFVSTIELFEATPAAKIDYLTLTDTAQSFALRLKKAIAGYKARLDPTDDIVVMGIDSATPGRMGVTFYREIKGADFLARVERWHEQCAWPQYFGKDRKFIGAPAPHDIAEAAYGRRLDQKLRNATVERLLPCIVDGLQVPRDLVESTARRASNRVGFQEHWEWEKCLGIACSLFKKYHSGRGYQMELEHERTTRDYLYGRLLALADNIEGYALRLTDEGKKRETTAARLMQRFSARPFTTWTNIELALAPYMARLKAGSDKSAGFLAKRRKLLDEIMTSLDKTAGRTSDAPLTGEFLLGFHSQRQAFWSNGEVGREEESTEQTVES